MYAFWMYFAHTWNVCNWTERAREGGKEESILWSPLCVIRGATRVPGVWHGLAPVITKFLLWLRNIHFCPSFTPFLHGTAQRKSERGGERDRKRESRQRPCECVSYGTDLVQMTPLTHTPHSLPPCPPSATKASHPYPTSLLPGQYNLFIKNANLL